MESDPDLTLETNRLEQLLETPPPPQSVVVVEYRNRGVPTWIFFPLIFMVPAVALMVYHRTVGERFRFDAAQTRESLEKLAAKEAAGRASQPGDATAANPTPAGTLYIVASGNPQTGPTPAGPAQSAAASDVGDGPKAATTPTTPAQGGPTVSIPPVQTGTTSAENPFAADSAGTASPPANPPADAPANRRITMRSVLPNPFADGAQSPLPPAPGDDAAPRPAGPGDQNAPVAGQSEPGLRPPSPDVAHNDPQPANESGGRDERFAPQPPLPSKEEALRQIEEEAAKLRAEGLVKVENKLANQRSQWAEEQTKFRDELREAINSFGNGAGPEIDKIAKRYGAEIDPVKWGKAHSAWRFSRGLSQSAKVKYIRQLELPDAVILDFISDDLHPLVKTRGGPRNESELRVRAAKLLLRYELPGTAATPRAGGPATEAAPAQTRSP